MINPEVLAEKMASMLRDNNILAVSMLNSTFNVNLTLRGWLVVARMAIDILEGKKS